MRTKIKERITDAAVCLLLFFMSCIDSEPVGILICVVGIAVCTAWLLAYA